MYLMCRLPFVDTLILNKRFNVHYFSNYVYAKYNSQFKYLILPNIGIVNLKFTTAL